MGTDYAAHSFIGINVTMFVQEWADARDDRYVDDWQYDTDVLDLLPEHLDIVISRDDYRPGVYVVLKDTHLEVDLSGFDDAFKSLPLNGNPEAYDLWDFVVDILGFADAPEPAFFTFIEVW